MQLKIFNIKYKLLKNQVVNNMLKYIFILQIQYRNKYIPNKRKIFNR